MLQENEVKRLMDVALTGVNNGMVTEARAVFNGILANKPGFAPALIGKALSHLSVGQFDDAEKILQDEVLTKNPDDADALVYLGMVKMFTDKKDEAAEIFEKLPDSALAKELLEHLRQ